MEMKFVHLLGLFMHGRRFEGFGGIFTHGMEGLMVLGIRLGPTALASIEL